MDTVNLRQQIEEAERHEQRTHELARLLHARLHHLHHRIQLVTSEPHRYLLDFVSRFVGRAPDLLDALVEIPRNAEEDRVSEAVGAVCLEFFFAPPLLLAGRRGMNSAMAKAYLCHRVIEEVNDCYQLRRSYPLLPLDFTCANLIVHQLIGDAVANLLDEVVHARAARLWELCQPLASEPIATEQEKSLICCRRHGLLRGDFGAALTIHSALPGCNLH